MSAKQPNSSSVAEHIQRQLKKRLITLEEYCLELQYDNPNVRLDAYNKGVRDATKRALHYLEQKERP